MEIHLKREPWELAQNQPGQEDTLPKKNNLDQYTEMEGEVGRIYP